MRLAFAAADDLLLTHAGVTLDDLDALGLPSSAHADAPRIAEALDAALADAVRAFAGAPLEIAPGLHRPGSAASGEGRGMLYHRPANPAYEAPELYALPQRRFDPRRLPRGLTQAIGHIQDSKCRKLLRDWVASEPAEPGELRHLITDGARVHYARDARCVECGEGVERDANAALLFLDGGMLRADPARYQLLDLDHRQRIRSAAAGRG
jgi:hypothetical protein